MPGQGGRDQRADQRGGGQPRQDPPQGQGGARTDHHPTVDPDQQLGLLVVQIDANALGGLLDHARAATRVLDSAQAAGDEDPPLSRLRAMNLIMGFSLVGFPADSAPPQPRRIEFIFFPPRASSSISLSSRRIRCIRGFSISSPPRYPQMTPGDQDPPTHHFTLDTAANQCA